MARYIDLEELEQRIRKYVKVENLEEKELVEWCKDECIRQAYCMPFTNDEIKAEVADLQDELKCEKETNKHLCDEYMSAKADTVRKMQAEIEARCIKGGIYPAFVKSTIDQIAEEILNDE